MQILNILIILVILAFGFLGFTRGLTKQIAIFVGTILVLIISYYLKDFVGDFLLFHCPFIKFFGGIQSFNIVFYQGIAFFLIVVVLEVLLNVVIAITDFFEKILKYTIVFGIPSKILGMILGFIEGYIVAFVLVFLISQPYFDDSFGIKRTEMSDTILTSSPILSSFTEDAVAIIDEVYHLKDSTDKNQTDLKILDLCLEKEVVSIETVDELVAKQKLTINNIESVLVKYRK